MDTAGDAQGSRALNVLPTDLEDRARRNRERSETGLGGPPDRVAYPPSQQPAAIVPAQPPPPTPPSPTAEQPAAMQPTAEQPAAMRPVQLPVARAGEQQQPTPHVLRLANDVRVLTYALSYVRKQLDEAVEACRQEASTRAAAEAEFTNARADVRRLSAEAERLRQSLEGAHRQAEAWSEQARRAETKAMSGLPAHEAAINQLRQTAAEQHAELERVRAERDAAQQRCAELEAALAQSTRHPRAHMASVEVRETPTPPAAAEDATLPPMAITPISTDIHDARPVALTAAFELDAWQRDALATWADAGHRGVIEAVTTEGYSRLALWAIGRALDADMKVLVIAPSPERAELWYEGLSDALRTTRIGRHNGRGHGRLAAYDVVVTTAQVAAKEHVFEPGLGVLVVADEVHELGTPELSRALVDSYPWRLGLTLAYERDDDGVATYLDGYFGGVCFRLDFTRAVVEQVVASFDLALASVLFSSAEQGEYDACAAATLVGGGAGAGAAKAAVRAYLKAVARRDELLAGTSARDAVLRLLTTAIKDAGRALVVAPTPQVADRVTRVLEERGCTVSAPPWGADGEPRSRRGGRVEDDRDTWRLVVPRDGVPPAPGQCIDLVIVVSPARTRRQLVERMDRALGGRQAGAHVRLVVVYVDASIEDELVGNGPLGGFMSHARRLQRFTGRDSGELLQFLAAGRRVVTLPADPAVEGLPQPEPAYPANS